MNSPLVSVVVSACLGALIGLIRQWSEQHEKASETDFGGVRTYTLWAVLGAIASFISREHLPVVLPVVLGLVGAQFILTHQRDALEGRPGTTSFVAVMLTCLIGSLVAWGYVQTAVLVSALTMVTLGIKKPLHAWMRAFTPADIRATLQFAAITGVILPLVPNRAMGPYEAFNPYSTWMMVVLISGIGFAGYILMRLLGAQAGITVTGLVGGLASSTATTLAFSRRSREDPAQARTYALAVVLACTVMLGRVLFMIGVVNLELMRTLIVPIAAMAVPGVAYSIWNWLSSRGRNRAVDTPALHNPLSLRTAVKFALLYTLFAFLIKVATQTEWKASLLPLSFISGLTDVDAIALLMANSQRGQHVILETATKAVVIGAIGNSVAKAGLAIGLGSGVLRTHVAIVLGATVLAAVAALVWL